MAYSGATWVETAASISRGRQGSTLGQALSGSKSREGRAVDLSVWCVFSAGITLGNNPECCANFRSATSDDTLRRGRCTLDIISIRASRPRRADDARRQTTSSRPPWCWLRWHPKSRPNVVFIIEGFPVPHAVSELIVLFKRPYDLSAFFWFHIEETGSKVFRRGGTHKRAILSRRFS